MLQDSIASVYILVRYLAEVRMSYLDRPYFVTMGTYQMAILLTFNERQELTLSDIEVATKLTAKELENITMSPEELGKVFDGMIDSYI